MKSAEIREKFLSFFASKGHQIVASSSLVPHEDPTLLFTNAGMNQFKDVFLGFDKRSYQRACSSQKCVRAGGKHNDLENVGYTARHHTFFEMLGNFSFGDYFKKEAIHYAWELLTEVFKLPPEKLWVTVYAEDEEAFAIWTKEIGVPLERVVRIGDNKGARYASDNFWMMGDTGPCGPCSEIFYDHGEDTPGGPPGSPDEEGDRYIEIWNNVFMQFNRDENGEMHPLPKPSVDTGMGLERLSAVLQHVRSNYETDLLSNLVKAAARETAEENRLNPSLRVLADHIRACSFLIADGVIPGNEGRGYVLRRIIRRAIRHGYKLGVRQAFFCRLVPDLLVEMGEAYPELIREQTRITETLLQEEERFFATIEQGMRILEAQLDALLASGKEPVFSGEIAFKLHDTYGFPLDLTADICRERGLRVDQAGFETAMAHQKEQARAAGKFKVSAALDYNGDETIFLGYERLECEAKVLALYKDGKAVDRLEEGDFGSIVLSQTTFYAESGGQVGDQGVLQSSNGVFTVEDTQKIQAAVFGHHGVLNTGKIGRGDTVKAKVSATIRQKTRRNHSATHLMHKALREVLGEHVAQKGSQVDSEKTRFDFVHTQAMSAQEIRQVENLVNAAILTNAATQTRVLPIAEAQKLGATMLFGEKYGDEVRVVDIAASRELCGGTHVERSGDIGLFSIRAESGIAAGVRRIDAVTGEAALERLQTMETLVNDLAKNLKVSPVELSSRVQMMSDENRRLAHELTTLKGQLASNQGEELITQAIEIKGIKLVAANIDNAEIPMLRDMVDKLRDKLQSALVVLASVTGEGEAKKAFLIVGLTPDLKDTLKAGELASMLAASLGGKGGGRPDMAQGGGPNIDALPAALASVDAWVRERV